MKGEAMRSPLREILDDSARPDPTGPPQPLTDEERAALTVCEAAVTENIGAWVNVTNALAEIHARRLYRRPTPPSPTTSATGGGFPIAGPPARPRRRVAMSPVGDKIRNERQAREVAALLDDPAQLVTVVERAEELRAGKPLTAAALRQARAELLAAPEDRETLRNVWTLEQLTAEVFEEGVRQRQRLAGRMLDVPPEPWPLGLGRWAKHHRLSTTDAAAWTRRNLNGWYGTPT